MSPAVLGLLFAQVLTGLDVLVEEKFRALEKKRVGLVTNHTGVDRTGKSAIDLLHEAKNVRLVAIFAPEHGVRGQADAPVPSGRDEKTGLVVHSLYGKTKKPTREMLEGVDTLVFDIQDIGARFYTYATTLGFCLEAASEHGKEVMVLDRPNPIGGEIVEGPILEPSLRGGFASYYALPTRHGFTMGELAKWYVAEKKLSCALTVVPVKGWKRTQCQDETGVKWVDPSPNMKSLAAATSYPGLGALEGTNLSVGRGTETPFELYGAPWVDARSLCADLNARGLAGVKFHDTTFTPRLIPGRPKYPHTDTECHGFRVEITDRRAYRPVTAVVHILSALRALHPKELSIGSADGMIGRADIEKQLREGVEPAKIIASWKEELEAFLEAREKFLLYRE